MTVHRPVVVALLLILVNSVILLIHAEDTAPLQLEDLRASMALDSRHYDDKDVGDHRQGRSLQADLPSLKVKREEALRNILVARRRQILKQRPTQALRILSNHTLRPPDLSTTKDSPDMLEAQETMQGIYVTAPSDIRSEAALKETSESLIKMQGKSTSESKSPSQDEASEAEISKLSESKLMEHPLIGLEANSTSLLISANKSASNSSRSSLVNQRASSLAPTSILSIAPKTSETEARKKNTVVMPESLYNHFRPVESNIPVEDMTQFLYFGQKLHPETHNMTANNSVVDSTSTVSTNLLNSRRRYSVKRYSTTTVAGVETGAMPGLEEIMNEEMNIAVERQTVEKNKISTMKNSFRSPASGIFYRKPRPGDSTILTSNVIPGDSVRNSTNAKSELVSRDGKSRINQSAHATSGESPNTRERGSATHVIAAADAARNVSELTQIPASRRSSSSPRNSDEIDAVESGAPDTFYGNLTEDPVPSQGADEATKTLRESSQTSEKSDNSSAIPDVDTEASRRVSKFQEKLRTDTLVESPGPTVTPRTPVATSRESNNIETSTSRDKTVPYPPDFARRLALASEETSTLRIVVTEGNIEHDFTLEIASRERNTVKPMNYNGDRSPVLSQGDEHKPKPKPKPKLEATTSLTRSSMDRKVHVPETRGFEEGSKDQQQHQQQHVYAYTITNVTRLLRNYTGPGLSREEQGGPRRSTGTVEITTGAPLSSTMLLPSRAAAAGAGAGSGSGSGSAGRAGNAGIEPERLPGELSTGTTVEPDATAAGSPAVNLVGERHTKVAGEPQSQRATGRATSSSIQTSTNKSATARGRQEVTTRGSIRWNHSKTKNFELDGVTERRLLRKSASAVLNQRAGPSGGGSGSTGGIVDDDNSTASGKRRRIPSNNRRVNQEVFSGNEGGPFNASLAPFNDSLDSEKSPLNDRKTENEPGKSRGELSLNEVNRGMVAAAANQTEFSANLNNSSMLLNANIAGEKVNGTALPLLIFNSTLKKENRTDMSALGEHKLDTKDESRDARGEFSVVEAMNDRVPVDSDAGSSTVRFSDATVTESAMTDSPKERAQTTTMSTPSFPVTPKILTEVGKAAASRETFTLSPTETPNQVTETKSAEHGRPFGMSADLDPSEIQKMYRSKDAPKTESPPGSTSTPEPRTITHSPLNSDAINGSDKQQEASGLPSASTSQKAAAERSPEVRGRNLSDETKDKDDVLPIMHLYNTSDIFNGSDSMEGKPNVSGKPQMDLPVEGEQVEGSGMSVTADETVNSATKKPESISGASSTSRVPLPDAKEASPSTRKDNKEDSVGTTIPPRTHNVSSHSMGNRTRHRPPPPPPPPYHHTILPEFNNSVYLTETNRTFFDNGMISVSPRESVNISEVISKRHDGDTIASQETVAVVSYILATLVVFPIAIGVGIILRRLIFRNRKVLEESDTSSEISCRKDALNLENGDFKTSIEKAITKLPRIQHLCHEAEKPPPPPTQESRWEFPRDKLRLQTVLGQGNFGQVWKAEADDLTGHQGTTRLVAVKTVKEGASDREKEDLVRELEIMQQLGSHPNVVTLLGCCTEEEPHYLILEYVMYGKLLAYLRDHRTRQDFYNFSEDSAALTSRDLTVFGYCVARGMEYLASKKIIHRDLAARNVLVDHNKLCKIADFGMSRFANADGEVIETRHGRNALPIRWMAPESLMYSLFTTKTDVWSFGILMWEIVTLGSTPYPDMTAREVMRNVQNGYRLERPSHCRSELFRVIARCWHADPDRRPEFQTLRRDLAQLLEDNMNGHYVDLESFASECTD